MLFVRVGMRSPDGSRSMLVVWLVLVGYATTWADAKTLMLDLAGGAPDGVGGHRGAAWPPRCVLALR